MRADCRDELAIATLAHSQATNHNTMTKSDMSTHRARKMVRSRRASRRARELLADAALHSPRRGPIALPILT